MDKLLPSDSDMERLLFENRKALIDGFGSTLRSVLPRCQLQISKGEKGQLQHIYITFLRTGIITRHPWLRIDLYDENEILDFCECSALWDIPSISQKIYAKHPLPSSKNDIKRDYEVEKDWIEAGNCFFRVLAKHISGIVQESGFKEELHDVKWHFGEYMGQCQSI